jgi:hypothetical protein
MTPHVYRGPGSNVNQAAMLSRGDLVNPHVERADALRLRIWPRRSAGECRIPTGTFRQQHRSQTTGKLLVAEMAHSGCVLSDSGTPV